jgi:hypothetical protein
MKHIIIPQIIQTITQEANKMHEFTATNKHFQNIQLSIKKTIEQHEKTPKPRRKPWCDTDIKRQIKKQHKLHQTYINNPTTDNQKKHKEQQQNLKKKIQETKRKHATQKMEQANNDPKEQAKILNSMLNFKSNSRTSPTTLTYENETYTDPTLIANALNDHYITIARKTKDTIPKYEPNEQNTKKHKTAQKKLKKTIQKAKQKQLTQALEQTKDDQNNKQK